VGYWIRRWFLGSEFRVRGFELRVSGLQFRFSGTVIRIQGKWFHHLMVFRIGAWGHIDKVRSHSVESAVRY
jgi:hypothetical protein